MPLNLQVHRQAAGEGGLAGGGGTRHQHHVLILLRDIPGDGAEGALVQGFVHADKVPQAALINHDGDV